MRSRIVNKPEPLGNDTSNLPRRIAGEDFRPGDGTIRPYVVLVPSDTPMDEAALMKLYITDVLARNGVRVSPETIDTIIEMQREENGRFDFNADKKGIDAPKYRDMPGPTDGDLNIRGTITGHGALMSVDFQRSVIERAMEIEIPGYGQNDPASNQKLIDTIAGMKNGATAVNNGSLKEALDTMENILKAKQEGKPVDGMAAATASLKFLAEIGAASKLDENAFEVFGKFAKGVGVPMDVYKFGENMWKVVNPNNGLSTAQRIEAATEAAENVLSIGEAFGTRTPLMVPIMAIRMQAQATEMGRQAISATAERNLTDRLDDGNTPPGVRDTRSSQERIDAINQRINRMPTNTEANAFGTCIRIMDTFKDIDTRSRFYQYLKQRIEPDGVLEAINNGKQPDLPSEKLQYLAERMKGMAASFMKAERDITKAVVVGDGAGKLIKEYAHPADHLKTPPKSSEIVDLNKPLPQKSREPLPDLLPKYEPVFDPEKGFKTDLQRQLQNRPDLQSALPADAEGRVVASLARAALDAGFRQNQPVQFVLSRDGERLIAYQGDAQLSTEKRVDIDIQRALTQPLENRTPTNSEATGRDERNAVLTQTENPSSKAPRMA
jgi:hypothetical protein